MRSEARDNFIEQMGLISQADGAPRSAGRILGLLVVEGRSFALNEIAERLQISKASVSTNARALADRGLIRLVARPGSRQDHYEAAPNPYRNMLQTIGGKLRRNATLLAEAEARFPDEDGEARERVSELIAFYRQSAELLEEWAAHHDGGRDLPSRS